MTLLVGLMAFTAGFVGGSYFGWWLFWAASTAEYRRRAGDR